MSLKLCSLLTVALVLQTAMTERADAQSSYGYAGYPQSVGMYSGAGCSSCGGYTSYNTGYASIGYGGCGYGGCGSRHRLFGGGWGGGCGWGGGYSGCGSGGCGYGGCGSMYSAGYAGSWGGCNSCGYRRRACNTCSAPLTCGMGAACCSPAPSCCGATSIAVPSTGTAPMPTPAAPAAPTPTPAAPTAPQPTPAAPQPTT